MYDDSSLLDKLDLAVPAPLAKLDAFPKHSSDRLYLSGGDGVIQPATFTSGVNMIFRPCLILDKRGRSSESFPRVSDPLN